MSTARAVRKLDELVQRRMKKEECRHVSLATGKLVDAGSRKVQQQQGLGLYPVPRRDYLVKPSSHNLLTTWVVTCKVILQDDFLALHKSAPGMEHRVWFKIFLYLRDHFQLCLESCNQEGHAMLSPCCLDTGPALAHLHPCLGLHSRAYLSRIQSFREESDTYLVFYHFLPTSKPTVIPSKFTCLCFHFPLPCLSAC